jgi:hypothetical protein
LGAASGEDADVLVGGGADDRELSRTADAPARVLADRCRALRSLARPVRGDRAGILPAQAAEHFIERARRIAESLELGIAVGQGAVLAKGERYRRADRPKP